MSYRGHVVRFCHYQIWTEPIPLLTRSSQISEGFRAGWPSSRVRPIRSDRDQPPTRHLAGSRGGLAPRSRLAQSNRRAWRSRKIVAACGLSTSLWFDADGASKRESYRQSLHATLAPLGRLVSSQLTEKFETDVQLEWGELKAGDIASSARAFRTMVEAGLSLSEAAALSGLMVAE